MVQEQLFTITKTYSYLESQLLIIMYLFTLIRQLLIKVTQNIRLESNCNYDQIIYSFNQLLTCSLRHKRQTTMIYYFKHMYSFTHSLITFTKLALNL